MKKKILFTVGIRPDGNKISPLYKKFLERGDLFETILVNTGQHAELLTEMLAIFSVKEDYNLKVMERKQTLASVTTKMLNGLDEIFRKERPDLVFAPNDGTTTFVTALVAYYNRIPVAHVEAGLRTNDLYNPFPEEGNRRMTSCLANYSFAPTPRAKANLLAENYPAGSIFVSGNTVIDALRWVVASNKNYRFPQEELNRLDFANRKVVLVTTHRRENWGEPMAEALTAIKRLVRDNQDVEAIFPMHPNPLVRETATNVLGDADRVHLIDALSYVPFALLQSKCYLVISDSGGIQEEAPTFGKPILVMRKTTERPEGIDAGVAKLVGTDGETIYREASRLLNDWQAYQEMSRIANPYGDGRACERIVAQTAYWLGLADSPAEEFSPPASVSDE